MSEQCVLLLLLVLLLFEFDLREFEFDLRVLLRRAFLFLLAVGEEPETIQRVLESKNRKQTAG